MCTAVLSKTMPLFILALMANYATLGIADAAG